MNSDQGRLNALAVRLHGRRVGTIHRLGGDRCLFSFEQDYLNDEGRETLSLSFKGQSGGVAIPTRAVVARLPAFFSNLLPEGHLREYLAVRAGVKPRREFFLLAALGADLSGAITVESDTPSAIVSHRENESGSGENSEKSVLRFSLAGVQLKFSAIMEASGGLTIPAGGMGGSWIVKLPSGRFPAVPENEYAMMSLARAAGLQTPRTELIDIRCIYGLPSDVGALENKALAVQRFDRDPEGTSVHMEDFAQVFGIYPDDKYRKRSYANIAAVLWAETGESGVHEFLRRLAFSVLIGNADMHLKNWALLYPDRRAPMLSPAYDLLSTLPYIPGDKLALTFGGSRSLDEITPDQIRRFADTARLPSGSLWKIVAETAGRTVDAWEKLAEKDLLPSKIRAVIDSHIYTVAQSISKYTPKFL